MRQLSVEVLYAPRECVLDADFVLDTSIPERFVEVCDASASRADLTMFSELPSFLRLTIYGWCGNVILGESTTLDRSLETNFPAMKACE